MDDEYSWLPFLLQTSDALFPTGAYAHSLGFEESIRLGLVRDEATLLAFATNQLLPALRDQELPYLRFAYEAAKALDIGELCLIDNQISAWKVARETREASKQLGTRRMKALEEIHNAAIVQEFAMALKSGDAVGHHLTVCAVQGVAEGVPLRASLLAFYYLALSSLCGAAMKLIRIGQSGCQRVLRKASTLGPDVVNASLLIAREDAGWFNPLLEIASMRHERAEERLFIS